MTVVGTAQIECPKCGVEQDARLVQSINTRGNPIDKQRLLAGELNVLVCACGKRTQLAANVLFHDPDADYLCQVVPGGEAAMVQAADLFRAAGSVGTQRLVPSLNALIEKVKMLDARLEDWAVEMTKVLLLAGSGESDVNRVLLFAAVDREAGVLRWVLFGPDGPEPVASPLAAYERLADRPQGKPGITELRIDRAWAIEAVRLMIASAN